jgi:hypothetical protein
LLATPAGKTPLFGVRGWESQEFAQGGGSGAMHGRAHRRFESLQIHSLSLLAALEHYA